MKMAPERPQSRVECKVCHKAFSTKSHLQRHEATHAPSTKAACGFCGRAYLRSDVLRRHFRTCKEKGDSIALPHIKPGRRRKACNACVNARSFCDGEYPCEACLQKRLDCSFTHMQERSGSTSIGKGRPKSPQADRIPAPAKMAIPFLLHYADMHESEPGSLRLLAQCGDGDCDVNHYSNNIHSLTETWESLFNSFINTATLGPSCGIQHVPTNRFSLDVLEDTSTRLLSLLATFDSGMLDRVQLDLDKAKELFTPRNIATFLEALLDNPFNAHVFHAASFSLQTASSRLILTMVLLGGTYVAPHSASYLAQYSDIAESLVFDDSEFLGLVHARNKSPDELRILETLQAALFAMYLQTNHDNPSSIRRLRVQRFPAVITAVRTLNLTDIMNDLSPDCSSWDNYLVREGLVRVMVGIHLFNYYCVMFYRHPTQLKITETTFEIPQRDDLFHARDATEWERLYSAGDRPHDTMRLRTVLRDYMSAGHSDSDQGHYPKTLLGLFLVLSALHCVLFDLLALHAVMDDPRMFERVERGLDRWKLHWDVLCRDMEPASAKRAGFIIHAVEYWWVAKALIRHPAAALAENESPDTRHGFRRLVERLNPVGAIGAVPVLDKNLL
ncbi:hypothetical protein BO94DRAFT_586908 [Aspergillus sclerotioniger CBS 115572]|uniref:C2H2 finger domain protein n=1 Tax=Aspergillus sclerotioniger CBS 115572 TaxID=1450535 RepID=A0A317WBY4_9EURO|nr:hypothetical protein BO94DRAFT_586908 [Aspergillus sclerotioniger CBS 115572]PWY83863.1 hypothetical protein BO94DRAFT_586908 [Aspergillus sclerotioniger CBS 115572]